MKSIHFVVAVLVLAVFISPSPAFAQLTTGDMARLTDEQRYMFDQIENAVFWLTRANDTENTSTLTDDEISIKIFEYFINEGIELCRNADGPLCMDSGDRSLLGIYNDTITIQYKKIVAENQPTEFDSLFGWLD